MTDYWIYRNSAGKLVCEICGRYYDEIVLAVAGNLSGEVIEFGVCSKDKAIITAAMARNLPLAITLRGVDIAVDDIIYREFPHDGKIPRLL